MKLHSTTRRLVPPHRRARAARMLGGVAALTVAALALTGCAGLTGGGGDSGSGSKTITFTTWGSKAEVKQFTSLISTFEKQNSGAKVKLNVVPYAQMFSNIDAQLSAGKAPDVFRVDYGNLGVYSSKDQLLDVSKYFSNSEVKQFNPAMWQAVSYKGKPYGVPHQTDVSALLVNTDLVKSAGLDPSTFPKSQSDAWTWDQFADVATKLRAALPSDKYPFVYNWQQAGAARWLSWLFQDDGTVLDGTSSDIDSAAGQKALDFTKEFYAKNWVPPTSSPKSTTYADSQFTEGTVAMAFLGSFLVPDIDSGAKFDWTAIPMPKEKRGATDLGGNALVATKSTKNPDLSAKFLKFMVSADSMKAFCAATNELPTRKDLSGSAVKFDVRSDVMPVFVDQASTIEPGDVKQLTSPAMASINTALQDQLDAAFTQGQSTKDTLANLKKAAEDAAKS